MRTEQLVAELAANPGRVRSPVPRLALAMAMGTLCALLGLTLALGSPLGPVAERGLGSSAMKLLYPSLLAAFGAAAALAAGRPGDRAWPRLLPVGTALLVLLAMTAAQLSAAAPGAREELLFGSTLLRCVTAVVLSSVPVFVALTWAFRSLAPTNLPFAGFLIGLASGGAAAAAYALFCPETSRAFLLTAYTPAMLIPAVAGAIAGPKLLRW